MKIEITKTENNEWRVVYKRWPEDNRIIRIFKCCKDAKECAIQMLSNIFILVKQVFRYCPDLAPYAWTSQTAL